MAIEVISNRGFSGGGTGINPSRTARFLSGFGASAYDESGGFDDGTDGALFSEDITVVAPSPAEPVPSRPFDLASPVSSVLSFLANGLQATTQANQQAALLASQRQAAARQEVSAGAWVSLGLAVVATAGVVYWIAKG